MVAPTLKSALNHYLQPTNLVEELRYRPLIRPSLSEADRAHLERWLKEVRDPVWGQLAAATRRHGKLPAFVEGPYSYFIGSALRARHFAESETDPPAMRRKRKQQREQQERSDLIALADKMEEVVRHYQACRKAQHPQRVPSPSGIPLSPLLRELETKQSLEWLGRNAHRLRQLAEKKVSAGVPVHVSRQSGGKGKRNQSREVGVFMREMVNCMYDWCGKPRYRVVAAITNIAFPDADVVAEDVRSACRPTTRTARRKRCTQPMK
ncbi:MAG: hypothetical protein AUI16_21785 [Alphaproteobacteria bacterium 13_2_20CM_2_64_7]|jgi:hypothetical protein|nr:MAG: hypothetical protein AUI16_21785 [Alphaproteobacteria bacterium 13_2_20CM_2_64_7]